MYPNPIIKYVVRRPGNTAWSEHRTERAAKRSAEKANRICAGHRVFAEHKDGSVTGPY